MNNTYYIFIAIIEFVLCLIVFFGFLFIYLFILIFAVEISTELCPNVTSLQVFYMTVIVLVSLRDSQLLIMYADRGPINQWLSN